MSATCRACDSSLAENDKFCENCGQAVSAGLASSASTEATTAATAATAAQITPAAAGLPSAAWPEADRAGASWTASVQPGTANGAAVGQATPNATYIGQRLLYEKVPESSFDPIVSARFFQQMLTKASIYIFIWVAGGITAWIFFLILIFLIGSAGLIIGGAFTVVTALVLSGCFWLLPLPAQLSEWKFSIDGKAAAGPAVFEHIAWVLKQRETPLDTLQVKRLNLPGDGKRDYLELRRGLFRGYVACFPFGQDLYVGWTFWVSISPLRWVLMALGRIWQTITNRGSDLFVSLRFDSARAMREAMHSSVREGIDVAIGQLASQGHGIVGTVINVEETTQLPQ